MPSVLLLLDTKEVLLFGSDRLANRFISVAELGSFDYVLTDQGVLWKAGTDRMIAEFVAP